MGTLILPSYLIARAGEAPRPEWGARVVEDRITAVGPNADLKEKYPGDVQAGGLSGCGKHPEE